MRVFTLLLFTLFSQFSFAEIYKDFVPYMTLKEIKEHYPNANIEEVKAAWVTKDDGFYKLTGFGISGTIYLAFNNDEALSAKYLHNYEKEVSEFDENTSEETKRVTLEMIETYKKDLQKPLEEKLSLLWVRWVPSEPLLLQRVESKYGKVEFCDINSEDFKPYCSWISKSLIASLSDDKKYVFNLEFNFTKAEIDSEIKRLYGIDNSIQQKKPSSKISGKKKKDK